MRRTIHISARAESDLIGIWQYSFEQWDYIEIETATGVRFFFATPYHSWEHGTNENTNGLIGQYVPKGTSVTYLTQARCNAIARKLNTRPRKRLGFKTPEEYLYGF